MKNKNFIKAKHKTNFNRRYERYMKKITMLMVAVFLVASLVDGKEKHGKKPSGGNITEEVIEVSTDTVEYEVYEPTVVIRGRWGTKEGEFGIAYAYIENGRIIPIQPHPYPEPIYPTSIAVDSKGNIYILDIVNNRIQKFNDEGRYLLSIPVDSFVGGRVVHKVYNGYEEWGVDGDVDTIGINIVIDSEDNLYYYCVKDRWIIDDKTGKRKENPDAKGEVWMFKDDKLVKKWEVPVDCGIYYMAPPGLFLEEDDSIWIFKIREKGKITDKNYEIKENKIYTFEERKERIRKKMKDLKKIKNQYSPIEKRREYRLVIDENGVKVIKKTGEK